MKRVQHDQVKQGMKIKHTGRWIAIHHVYEIVPQSHHTEAHAKLLVSNVGGRDQRKFALNLYSEPNGYELHPQAALLAAQAHQRKGRAEFVKNVVLREYSIKFAAVDRVDNQGVDCGYCTDVYPHPITCNIYATSTTDNGRAEDNVWSTCEACALRSIDQVEDVDPAYTITIERVKR